MTHGGPHAAHSIHLVGADICHPICHFVTDEEVVPLLRDTAGRHASPIPAACIAGKSPRGAWMPSHTAAQPGATRSPPAYRARKPVQVFSFGGYTAHTE